MHMSTVAGGRLGRRRASPRGLSAETADAWLRASQTPASGARKSSMALVRPTAAALSVLPQRDSAARYCVKVTRDDSIRFRRATIADAEPLARGVLEGIEDYPSFAPPGWTAPSLEAELEHLRESLADEDVCCLVAVAGGDLIGQITVLPAARAPHPVNDAVARTHLEPLRPPRLLGRRAGRRPPSRRPRGGARARLHRVAALRGRRPGTGEALL